MVRETRSPLLPSAEQSADLGTERKSALFDRLRDLDEAAPEQAGQTYSLADSADEEAEVTIVSVESSSRRGATPRSGPASCAASARPCPATEVAARRRGGKFVLPDAGVGVASLAGDTKERIMKAAVLHEVNQPLAIEDVEINKPGPREVLIRTAFAGLCHSDLHFIEGLYPHPLPVVLGHESAGIVEQVGSEVHLREEGRPRHHLPVGVLRHLRELHDRPAGHLHRHRASSCRRAPPSA